MTIELSYRYSTIDKTHCFGLVFNDADRLETYVRWVWFHLGQDLIRLPKKVRLCPYNYKSKVLKVYKNCNDASRQAHLIANKIITKLDKIRL